MEIYLCFMLRPLSKPTKMLRPRFWVTLIFDLCVCVCVRVCV